MAENKKSFVLYSDQRSIIDMLSDELAGKLLKHIYAYVNDENPICENAMINLAFEPIKLQLKRDLVKWSKTREGRSKAGLASAEARANKNEQDATNPTNVNFVEQTSTNPTVNVNVNDNVNVINNIYSFKEFWETYPNKTAKPKCEKKFNSLSNAEKLKIKETINQFLDYKPFETYNHPNPLTYLNQGRWTDVIPIASKQEVKTIEQEKEDKLNWFRQQGF